MSVSGGGTVAPAGKGHTGKHVGSKKHHVNHHHKHHPKHHKTGHHVHHKHHVHTKGKQAHHPRGYAIGDLLPVCTFEALAASLRLAGQRVAEDDLLELWWRAGSREVSIAEALDAAARFGLAGCKPTGGEARGVAPPAGIGPLQVPLFTGAHIPTATLSRHRPADTASTSLSLILGVDRPGPHAVLATPDGWWSWGELYSPWTRHVSEAWVISWT